MREVNFIVIVPVYNAEKYLERAVSSVVSQDHENWNLVLIDDGSTDASPSICDRLEREHDRISALHQENQGGIAARANGVRVAKEKLDWQDSYFLFLDSDDAFKPGAFSRIAQLLEEGDDMLIFGMEKSDADTGKTILAMPGSYTGVVEDKAELYKIVFFDYQYNSLCRKAISARVIGKAGFEGLKGVSRGWDLAQSVNYYKNSRRTRFVNDILYTYYQITTSVTHTNINKSSAVREYVWSFVASENVWDEDTWKRFSGYNCELLRKKITAVCLSDMDTDEKYGYFKAFREDEFYSRILAENPDHDKTISLFIREKYPALIRYSRVRSGLARIIAH